MAERIWNEGQLAAITSFGGNILVSAAAGSGKTAVLVERVIRMLTDEQNPVDADRLLIVTFTRLAAAEMRSRINAKLAELSAKNPKDLRLGRQLLLMDRAHIGTIHSFCSEVVRENTSVLGLMPDPSIADEDEAADISSAALEETIEKYYSEGSPVFSELAETLGGGRNDSGLSEAVLDLYRFISSLPHYEDWLSEKAAMYDPSVPVGETVWGKILLGHAQTVLNYHIHKAYQLAEKCDEEFLDKLAELCRKDAAVLEGLLYFCNLGRWDSFCNAVASASFERMPSKHGADEFFKKYFQNARDEYKNAVKKTLAKDFSVSEADFREDIADLYPKINCLFALTLDFAKRFGEMKREKRLIDYTDLEQFTLSVLTEKDEHGNYYPSEIAKGISGRFDHILIDECQDINKVQDTIFRNISRGDNLFFVGDVKQSIYRFRQAMPELFLEKRKNWPVLREGNFPATIILGKNYRSRKNIAGAVNYIFGQIMSEKAAEIEYDESEMLIPAAEFPEDGICRNEVMLIESENDSTKAEAEAVAERIYNMVLRGEPVFDGKETRPMRYSDICILFRSPKGKTEIFLSALRKKGISARSENDKGFLSRPEVAAVIDVLKAVDNPLLDIPLAGAMLSEMFLFTPDELAEMRIESRKIPLYSSVKIAAENGNEKAKSFISVLDSLRKAAAYERSDAVIERLYDITSFPQVMRSCPEGELKLANLRLLVKYAADREKSGAKGLSAFIRFMTRLEERESDLKPAGTTGTGNCVRIMSVHGSKGLEFPVVFLCGTSKQFLTERSDQTMLHPDLGFACPRRDPETGARFTTVPQLALMQELRRYNLAEEMRILYVALTRPKERLVITCCQKDIEKYLGKLASDAKCGEKLDPFTVSSAKCQADWVLTALLRHPDAVNLRLLAGLGEEIVVPDETRWEFSTGNAESVENTEEVSEKEENIPLNEEILSTLARRQSWKYPFAASEKIPAKAGVSTLTHQEMHKKMLFSAKPQSGSLSGAERGTALHTFMQFCDFDSAKADPKAEIERLSEKRFISKKQADVIDPRKVKAFFESELYRRIEKSPKVWRELRFLRGLSAAELGYEGASDEDKITVQGVADCVFEENGKLIVVDYKTDFVEDIEELRERYAAQLHMYKKLLSETLGKEVVSAVIWSFRFGKELEV